jgi:hypothetical protein
MSLRIPTALLLVSAIALAGCAGTPPSFRLISAGTYSGELIEPKLKTIYLSEDSLSLPGKNIKDPHLEVATTRILLLPETRFGIMYEFEGPRKRDRFTYRIVWTLPAPGLVSRKTGKVFQTREYEETSTVGYVGATGLWVEDMDDVMRYPEGTYSVELFLGEKSIFRQEFEVTKPAAK